MANNLFSKPEINALKDAIVGDVNSYAEQITQNSKDISSLKGDKVDKVDGKGLSTNDFTTEEKQKLAELSNYNDAEVKKSIVEISDVVIVKKEGINIYDELNNSTDYSQNTKEGTVYLDGYVGDVVISSAGNFTSYITTPIVTDKDGNVLANAFKATGLWNSKATRRGNLVEIPSDAYKITFRYRYIASSGTLAHDIMVTKGSTITDVLEYVPYFIEKRIKTDSDKVKEIAYDEINKVIYVSPDGSDSNDGMSIVNAVATFSKALTLCKHIRAKRGVYNENVVISDIHDVDITPYENDVAWNKSEPKLEKIVIDRNGASGNVITILNSTNINLTDVCAKNSTQNIFQCNNSDNIVFNNCEAIGSEKSMGFFFENSNGVLNNCYATENHTDGFNFHGYGTTVLNDCVSENNFDDGCSHHNGCVGTINGGRFEGNGKAGIAPAYGATVNIYNAICKNNRIGIGFLSTTGTPQMHGYINGCVMIDNHSVDTSPGYGLQVDKMCAVMSVNCKYSNNATDKMVTGTLKEF